MSKRKLDELLEDSSSTAPKVHYALDSDEEDVEENEDRYNVMQEQDLEGVEDGPSAPETNVGFTAFNMKEELEEGHFDTEGHYHWKKEKEIRDNWLDNIDWMKVKKNDEENENSKQKKESNSDSDSDEENDFMFNPTSLYKQILEFLKPGESVSKALCRLGKGKKKLTTAERWKKKKDPNSEEDESSIHITKLTEIANELLTRTGNMDIYQETYEQIHKKITTAEKHSSKVEAELDMFSDDFESKEKDKKDEVENNETEKSNPTTDISWELKWSQEESAEIHGPHTSDQMQTWAKEGFFKKGAWVRKTGQNGEFYSASRIDFELYL